MAIFGWIGVGNMGGALAKAAAMTVPPEQMLLSSPSRAQVLAQQLGASAVTNEDIAAQADYIILGVKPQQMEAVLQPLQKILNTRKQVILVSMAAGLTMEKICAFAGGEYPVIRIMPNLPAAVGCGMILYAINTLVTPIQEQTFLAAMERAGCFDRLEEPLMDAGSSIAGCGPAFVCQFVEALADGGVACGLPRKKALIYAQQMILGTAQMLLQHNEHPGTLKDAVCSPGGTTIQGVRTLEQRGMRSAVMDAVIAAYEASLRLKNK